MWKKFKKSLNGAKVLLLSVAYKKDIGDLRESPALEIVKKSEKERAIVSYYNPYIPKFINNEKEYRSLKELNAKEIREKDIVLITTAHSKVDYRIVTKNAKAIFDARNAVKNGYKKYERLQYKDSIKDKGNRNEL